MVYVSTKLRSFLSAVATLDLRAFLSLKCHEWSSSRSLRSKLESNFNLQLIQTPPRSSEGVSKVVPRSNRFISIKVSLTTMSTMK